jgi:hypothetical protein
MDKKTQTTLWQRAVNLGNSGDPVAVSELIELSRSPVPNVRRLAASAMRGRILERLRQYR